MGTLIDRSHYEQFKKEAKYRVLPGAAFLVLWALGASLVVAFFTIPESVANALGGIGLGIVFGVYICEQMILNGHLTPIE